MTDYAAAFVLFGLGGAVLKFVSNKLYVGIDDGQPVVAPGGPGSQAAATPAAPAGAAGQQPAAAAGQPTGQPAGQPPKAGQHQFSDRDFWLLGFQGRGRDADYDGILTKFHDYLQDGDKQALEKALRCVESVIVCSLKLLDNEVRPSKAIHALMTVKYVDVGTHFDSFKKTIRDPQRRRAADSLIPRTEALVERYYKDVIVSRCMSAS